MKKDMTYENDPLSKNGLKMGVFSDEDER